METNYNFDVSKGYSLSLSRSNLPGLVSKLRQEGIPAEQYTSKNEDSEFIIYGKEVEVYVSPVINPEGPNSVKGKVIVKEGSDIDPKKIENIVKQFSITENSKGTGKETPVLSGEGPGF